MSERMQGRSLASSLGFHTLCDRLNQAGAAQDALPQILWRIGAHPALIAHDRVLGNLADALGSEVFRPESLYWASSWRWDVDLWIDTIRLVSQLGPQLRAEPVLRDFFREPRNDQDHPILHNGAGRHPIAACLFNVHQSFDTDGSGRHAPRAVRFDLVRSHVLAMYFEARSRAAHGLDEFLAYEAEKEFAPVPLGAGPVGLALRELSLDELSPLLMQLPSSTSTPEFAYRMAAMQADFSELPRHLRERAARYLSYLQRYLAALPALLHATRLEARTRLVEDPASGPGGSSHRPGWVGWSQGEIKRQQEPDWDDTAPGITHISLPAEDEPDPQDEEADGDMPGSTRDSAIELYDPLEAIKVMSRMRFRRLHLELRSQEFMWSLDIASRMERMMARRAAQSNIDLYLTGTPTNRGLARIAAVGGIVVKACLIYGWAPESTAAINLVRVDRFDADTVESLCYLQRDHICLLVQQPAPGREKWTAVAFLLPEVSPRYQTQLSAATEAAGRLRQRAFLLPDVGGLGQEILAIAASMDRLPSNLPQTRRALGVESKTASRAAKDCLSLAGDAINEDPRATLTMGRVAASTRAGITAVSGDLVAAWLITQDHRRCSEARLHYTQIQAAKLPLLHEAALQLLDADKWTRTDAETDPPVVDQPGWVGCRHVVDTERLQALLVSLQARLAKSIDLTSRSAIRDYHNDFTFHAWLLQSLSLGLRAGSNRPSVWHDIELRQGAKRNARSDCTGMADKHNGLQDKSRLLPITDDVVLAAHHLQRHNAAVLRHLDLACEWRTLDANGQRHFVISEREALAPLTPGWIRQKLAELGLPIPVNFARALLRTEWLNSGCTGLCIDGFLGHFDHGQNLFAKHSSHDPQAYLECVTTQLSQYVQRLGLRPLPSVCAAATERSVGPGGGHASMPSVGLKQHMGRQLVRPVWWKTNLVPILSQDSARLWSQVRRHASRSDSHWLTPLLWALRNWSSPHARVLVKSADETDEVLDESSACQLEDEVLLTVSRHQLPRTVVASWLRMLLAAQTRLRQDGMELVTTRVAALTTNPESPISPSATLRRPLLARWETALHHWVVLRAEPAQAEEDPRYWAIAIGLSAVVHGMVLDMRLLSSIMEWLARPGPRSMQLCAGPDGFAFLEFELPSSLPGSRQCVRWFPDPLTESLLLRAPSFPVTPELAITSRYVGPFLRHHGVAPHHCPSGWRDVVKASRALWSTRVPQYLVQCAQRGISTTSLTSGTWTRLFGACVVRTERSGALLTQSQPSPSEMLTLDDLTFDPEEPDIATPPRPGRDRPVATQWIPAGRDIDHLRLDMRSAHPWMADADEALRHDSNEIAGRLDFLSRSCRAGSFAEGALRWLSTSAKALLDGKGSAEGDPMVGLRRVASTLLPRLAAEMGDTWFDETEPDQRTQVLGALTHELETGASGLDLRRGLALLQSEEENLRVKAVDPQVVKRPAPSLDIEDPDGDIRVDARMLTVDEHLKALSVIRTGIQPPLRPAERSVIEDMLHLGIWTLARPREYLELRLGDFQTGADGMLDVVIREYAGHGLKTPQATRRVPLSLLAPSDVNQRFRDCLDSRLKGSPTAALELRRELFFAAPEGEDVRRYHNRLLGLLRQILQQVTGDPGVRAYSLRHTGANWLFMALESDGSWLWERLWSAHPAMKRYVLDGNALRMRLLGTTDRADRRAVLAITKLQGHLAAATTFMHYLHTTALMQLQAVYKFADSIPKAVLASAARISPSTLSEQGVGPSRAGLQHSRTRAGWTVTQPSVPEPLRRDASNKSRRWLSFGDLQVALDAHANHQQTLANIAAHFERSEDSIHSIIETAAGISGWMASCGEINPASDLQTSRTPDVRMNAAERLQVETFSQNIEVVWRCEPKLVVDAVGVIMDRMTRLHDEIALTDPLQLQTVLAFFHQCGMAAHDLQFVLRRRNGENHLPGWAAGLLGPYACSTVRLLPPDTRSSDAALERWLRLRLVDRKGQAIPNVLKRALFTAWVNMSVGSV